jgi:hypothetical protein
VDYVVVQTPAHEPVKHVSPNSHDSEKTLFVHHSSPIQTIVETGIPAHVLQQLELELHNPSPQKSQNPQLTIAENDYLKTFEEVITPPPTEQDKTIEPSNVLDKPSSSSVPNTLKAITPEDVKRVLMGINDKVQELHHDLPALAFAPDQVDGECSAIADMCKQMMNDLSSQYRRNFIMNIARHKFTEYKAEENRIRRAKRLYDEKMKLVMTKAVDQFSTFYAQEMEKIIQVDSDSANLVGRMDSEDVFKRLQLISEEALKQLQAKMLNPSNPSQP